MARPTNEFILRDEDKIWLVDFHNQTSNKLRERKRAYALIMLDRQHTVKEVSKLTGFSEPTIYRLRTIYQEKGVHPTIKDKPRAGRPQQVSEEERKKIIALALKPPAGKLKKWTLRSLADYAGKIGLLEKGSISHTEVARILKEEGIII